MERVALIATGSELVYGSIQDQNNAFISRSLFNTGLSVVLHSTVGDDVEELKSVFSHAAERAGIIIITGGLGPTDDDHTVEALKDIYDFDLIVDEDGRKRMEAFFRSVDREPIEGDLKMVTVPEGSLLFPNDVGLATGFLIERDGKMFIAMPGVPNEMRPMFQERVLPYLIERFALRVLPSLELKVAMKREAEVNLLVREFAVDFGKIVWGITTSPGLNSVTFVGKDGAPLDENALWAEAERVFGDALLARGSSSIEEEVVRLLRLKGRTLATAESCTGGLVAKKLTDIPGASAGFTGGIIAYGNEVKKKVLEVPGEILENHGAVSEETAAAMARGALLRLKSDYAVAITGIAGPDGGTGDKPVGTVCFGVADGDRVETFARRIMGDRERVRLISALYALDKVRHLLLK